MGKERGKGERERREGSFGRDKEKILPIKKSKFITH